jgi:hypothetical protein
LLASATRPPARHRASPPDSSPICLTPALRPRIERNLARFCEVARLEAAAALRAHGEAAAADALPATCPYRLDQITGDWLPG